MTSNQARARQPIGAPRSTGGQFATASRPATQGALSDPSGDQAEMVAQFRVRRNQEAEEMLSAEINEETRALAADIIARWPNAARLVFEISDSTEMPDRVVDQAGNTIVEVGDLWDEDDGGEWEDRLSELGHLIDGRSWKVPGYQSNNRWDKDWLDLQVAAAAPRCCALCTQPPVGYNILCATHMDIDLRA